MDRGSGESITTKIRINGKVQGVGFRPFLACLAKDLDVKGEVCNIGGMVELVITADEGKTRLFLDAIRRQKPQIAVITAMESERVEARAFEGFAIIESKIEADKNIYLSADLPLCEECRKELFDPSNRRYLHPFISCSVCGPRYSILNALPYDRDNTTMAEFGLCPACEAEYKTDSDRRFHAQTVSCHDCGPFLIYDGKSGHCERELALEHAVDILRKGGIVAVKGVGGYHLAASPFLEESVKRLRNMKGREQKPFAVMFRDTTHIRQYAVVGEKEEELLISPARPIVLLRSITSDLSPVVSKGSLQTGAFLPYTPLQALLMEACGALIMTSANRSDMPIITQDEEMLRFEGEGLDGVLYNTRKIATALDDSVVKVVDGNIQMIRRSRGYVPEPIGLGASLAGLTGGTLAAGGDLKSTFCLANAEGAVLSQPFGDLEELAVYHDFQENLERMKRLYHSKPQVVACDKHPNYVSSVYAKSMGIPVLDIQHHHAHIGSVMAEHQIRSPMIGVAFDGTGYGEDGTIWGGEFLVCEGADYTRCGHLRAVPLLGGDSSARDAKKTALCHVLAAGLDLKLGEEEKIIAAAVRSNINTTLSSSMGRLFDAVASILDIKQANSFEGECAILLENQAQLAIEEDICPTPLAFEILEDDGMLILNHFPVIAGILNGVQMALDCRALALGFHLALAEGIVAICKKIGSRAIINQVALSGGVFQNGILLSRTMKRLADNGFDVYINRQVPPNDGGIALGQVWFAGLRGLE